MMGFADAQPHPARCRESKNLHTFRALDANQTHQGSLPQFHVREPNKQCKKYLHRINRMAAAGEIS
jgi:hypothetical protein